MRMHGSVIVSVKGPALVQPHDSSVAILEFTVYLGRR